MPKMRPLVVGTVLLLGLSLAWAEIKSPKVNLYTERPLSADSKNTIICYVESFHPPLIEVKLLRNGEEIPGCRHSDLTFQRDWTYQMISSADVTPREGDTFQCKVLHNGVTKTYEQTV
ncbi:beta-2-microglobulin [Spea bombifrons]|uniref:beta-2-microglobulin n=1 Tax=Spea bombifrons TaxID=233779 RepID=UPI00234A1FEF|nr:beta-2-microglobulin [Spea bombifrons]